jgi:hypothetical protein
MVTTLDHFNFIFVPHLNSQVNVMSNIHNWHNSSSVDDPQVRIKKLKSLEQESITKLSEIEMDLSLLEEKIKVLEVAVE